MILNEINRKVLGIDLGLKKTGLAISDKFGISSRVLKNLIPKSRKEDINYIIKLCIDYNVKYIVIGCPLTLKSTKEGVMGRRAYNFSKVLELILKNNKINITIHLIDEYYTSKEAMKRLINSNIPQKKRIQAIDGEVARILIENFLSEKQN